MRRLFTLLTLAVILSPVAARAEKPLTTGLGLDGLVSPGELKATPEMWFYDQQMRHYNDPKMMVRANAEFHHQQRLKRIAAMKWYGMSNARPRASSDPFNGDYSPQWVANPIYYPYRWNGIGHTSFYWPY
jgi:hypothetical protein